MVPGIFKVKSGVAEAPSSFASRYRHPPRLHLLRVLLIEDLLGDDARRALIAYHRLVGDELPYIVGPKLTDDDRPPGE